MNTSKAPIIVGILALLASGCTSGAAADNITSEPTTGCEKVTSRVAKQDTILVDGVERSFYIVPSTDSTSNKPVDLVFYFHGYGGNGKGSGEWNAGEPNRITVYPDGVVQTWYQDAIGWDTRSNDTPDLKFIQVLLDTLKANYCVDQTKVFATGFSWGGWMANAVGCAMGDQLAGIVPAAGGGPSVNAANCHGSVPAVIYHATNDDAESVGEGKKSRDFWMDLNGCDTTSTPFGTDGCVAYDGCATPVVWCEHNGGHSTPSYWLETAWKVFGR